MLQWLLDKEQPAVRWLTLTMLLDRKESDPDVVEAKSTIPLRGWAADILRNQTDSGRWASDDSLYMPKYLSSNWMLIILSDLGMTKEDVRIAKSAELWIDEFSKEDGGFNTGKKSRKSELCITGNTARSLVKFGYAEHQRVRSSFEWLVKNQHEKGGWSCWGSGRNLDSWEGLSAFASYPKQLWTRSMHEAVEKGAEFFLERELHKQGKHYEPWYRFHYPVHYYYDLLVGLDFMTRLGYCDDRRLDHAVDILKRRMLHDGRWLLDAIHPDVEGKIMEYWTKNPHRAPLPFALEEIGMPSKMITLTALGVLRRIEQPG